MRSGSVTTENVCLFSIATSCSEVGLESLWLLQAVSHWLCEQGGVSSWRVLLNQPPFDGVILCTLCGGFFSENHKVCYQVRNSNVPSLNLSFKSFIVLSSKYSVLQMLWTSQKVQTSQTSPRICCSLLCYTISHIISSSWKPFPFLRGASGPPMRPSSHTTSSVNLLHIQSFHFLSSHSVTARVIFLKY